MRLQGAKPKRYWFRRLLAFGGDVFLAFLLSTLLLASFVQSSGIRLSTGAFGAKCFYYEADDRPAEWREEYERRFGSVDAIDPKVCGEAHLPFRNGRWLILQGVDVSGTGGDVNFREWLVLPLSDRIWISDERLLQTGLSVVDVWYPQPVLTMLLLILFSALCLRLWRTTPGKWLLRLKVTGQGCELCRCFRQYGVFLLWAIIVTANGLYEYNTGRFYVLSNAQIVVIGGFIFLLWYYVYPFIRWTGQHRWDKATGFYVVSKRDNVAQEARP